MLRFGASQIPSVRVVASFISVHYTLHALFIPYTIMICHIIH